jgi:2,4-dienoyl-CoA reductase (NADPH2)
MSGNSRYRKLLEPGKIGPLNLKNRMLKMGASPGSFLSQGGFFPENLKNYYEALSRGGTAVVTVAGGIVKNFPLGEDEKNYRVDDDRYIPGLREVADIIKKNNAVPFMQLMGQGATWRGLIVTGDSVSSTTMSQSELPLPQFVPTRGLTVEEIQKLVVKFGDTAERFQKAGFQGVELNSANNHLLNSFLSRAWNRRQDAYGPGSLESRTKFITDIIREIKKRNGKDFVICSMICGLEIGLENGITIDESSAIAGILEKAGVDAIHVRPHFYYKQFEPEMRWHTEMPEVPLYPEVPPGLPELFDTRLGGRGGWAPIAARIKKAVSIPVIAVGRLDADLGEQLLRRGDVDFINMNRRIMADHDYANKIITGKTEDIRVCTGCYTCYDNSEIGQPPKCMVNAAIGKEKEYEIKPAARKKKVLIIGGGPAGMEAARVAASRGHQVILYEKQNKLGGSLPLAAMVKGFEREDFMGFVRYLNNQMTRLNVDVRTGKEINRSIIEEIKPDVLILATGGLHNIPDIPGINGRNVVSSQALHTQLKSALKFFSPQFLNRLTHYWMPVGKNVVIMGGGIHGCQTASFLVKRGRKVTIVDTNETIGNGLLEYLIRPWLLHWLAGKGTEMLAGVKYEEITSKGLTVTTKDGKKRTIEANTIITALPLLPDQSLIKNLEKLAPEFYAIGDCNNPKLTVDAVAEGSRIGLKI